MKVKFAIQVVGVICDVDCVFFFQAEDGIRDLVRSRGLGDVYKRQRLDRMAGAGMATVVGRIRRDPILDLKFVLLGHNLSLIHI